MWIKETSLCCYQFGKKNVFIYKDTYTNALFVKQFCQRHCKWTKNIKHDKLVAIIKQFEIEYLGSWPNIIFILTQFEKVKKTHHQHWSFDHGTLQLHSCIMQIVCDKTMFQAMWLLKIVHVCWFYSLVVGV